MKGPKKPAPPRKARGPSRKAVLGAPPLTGSLASIRRCTRWLAEAVLAGKVSHSQAIDFGAAIAGARAEVRLRHALHELDTLRALVARMERAKGRLREGQVASRYNGGGDSDTMMFDADDAPAAPQDSTEPGAAPKSRLQ